MAKRLVISMFAAVLLALLFAIMSPNKAHAEETVVQVVSDPAPASETATATTPVTVEIVAAKVETSETTLQAAAQAQGNAIISTIQANVPNTDTQTVLQC